MTRFATLAGWALTVAAIVASLTAMTLASLMLALDLGGR